MAQEVFGILRALYGLVAADGEGFPVEFEDLEPIVRVFAETKEADVKIEILNAAMAKYGMEEIPVYDAGKAMSNRQAYLGELTHGQGDVGDPYTGVLLPEDSDPVELMEE